MLFTDGTILTIQDLREHDNFVLEVASTESMELNTKLAVAQREIGYEISSFLLTRKLGKELDRVVVTQRLRDLLATHTLSLIYREAYNLHLNDRYLGRWKEFSRASERSLLRYLQSGVGIAGAPVPQAEVPVISLTMQGDLAEGTYIVQVAWQHMAGNVGEKSPAVVVESAGGGMVIHAGTPPLNASGWHVFVGIQDEAPRRQNEIPIAASATWTQDDGLRHDLHGPEASGPDYYVRNSGQILRG